MLKKRTGDSTAMFHPQQLTKALLRTHSTKNKQLYHSRTIVLAMKMTIFLLIVALLQTRANSIAQVISFSGKDVPIHEVFESIKAQSGMVFFFDEEIIKNIPNITIRAHKMPLVDFLESIFKGHHISYNIQNKTVALTPESDFMQPFVPKELVADWQIQHIPVLFLLKNEAGKAMSGVTVALKNGTILGITDAEGKVSVKANKGDQFIFTFVSYHKLTHTITAQNISQATQYPQTSIHLTMEPSSAEMEDISVVVNTGYQTLNKERVTGSYVQIDSELFNRQVGNNVLEKILNITPGLLDRPTGGSSSIETGNNIYRKQKLPVIRGESTINGDKSLLIVVDNFPYEGDIELINPEDVESVTVLKDAAAASIWGARAGNGVIVITTKSGKFNKKPSIALNTSVTVHEKLNLMAAPIMNAKDVIENEIRLFSTGMFNVNDDQHPALNRFNIIPGSVEILLAARKENKHVPGYKAELDPEVLQQLDALGDNDVRKDIQKYLLQHANTQRNALNISGGGNNFNYYGSIGYDRGQGHHVKEKDERLSVNFRNTWKPYNKLEITTGIAHTFSGKYNGDVRYHLFMPTSTGRNIYDSYKDANENPLPIQETYRIAHVDTATYPALLDLHYYPTEDYKHLHHEMKTFDTRLSAGVKYEIIEGLRTEVQYQNTLSFNKGREYTEQNAWVLRDRINNFMSINSTGNLVYPFPLGDRVIYTNSETRSWDLRASVSYKKHFDKHGISFLAGADFSERDVLLISSTIFGFDPETYLNKQPAYTASPTRLGGTAIPGGGNPAPSGSINRKGNWFSNLAYDYKSRYLVTLSGRIDQSNFFGLKANLRKVPLWHAGFGWLIHQEDFYNSEMLPKLKLKMSYGYTGNTQGGSSYATFANYNYINTITGEEHAYGSLQTPANPELTWERVKIINLGVEFTLKNNTLNGSVEYFSKLGLDLMGAIQLDPTTGWLQFTGNESSMKGTGVELILNSHNISNKNFSWITNFNISTNRNKLIAYKNPSTVPERTVTIVGTTYYIVDKPINRFYSYKWAGLDPITGEARVYKDDKPITVANFNDLTLDDLMYHGTRDPKFYGAIRNSIRYGSFNLSANVTFRMGGFFRRASINYASLLSTGYARHEDYAQRWVTAGDELKTSVPSMPASHNANRETMYEYSSLLVERADQIRLQDIRLDYQLRQQYLTRLPFQRLSVFAYASNLGLLWTANKYGIDPENFNSLTSIPVPKQFSFGIQASF